MSNLQKTNLKKKIIELRESTGMNRKEFCDYFGIPYRTVTEWERDNRHAPEYLIRLLEYYIRAEKVISYIKNRFSYGERVAVFSHHGFLEYLIPTALGVKPHIFRFSLDNVSVTVVEFCRDGNTVLRYVNK